VGQGWNRCAAEGTRASAAVNAAAGAAMPEASKKAANGLGPVPGSPCASLRTCRAVSALPVRSARTRSRAPWP
ncbi:hypothetical protein, partial [Streptomyces sp. NPDC060027]|uniref:hypothetical protein n=1 Tax=Streptomyces sp. NPDC060027 TaxID=3347040 RepID=UPI0036AD6E11